VLIMITALAGRRIDAPGSQPERFPLRNVASVRARIRTVLASNGSTLVCSASCGADLIALDEAGNLRIRRRVVLPFARERFREMSVVDRPGDWGPLFDRIMDEVELSSDAVVLLYDPADPDACAGANAVILDEAQRISREAAQQILTVIVWEGKPRGDDDLTASFRNAAKCKGFRVSEVFTLSE
jgi:hypothetical protein